MVFDDLEMLKSNYELVQNTLCITPDVIFIKNTDLQYVAASDLFAQQLGYENGRALIGKTDGEVVSDPELVKFYHQVDLHILNTKENMMDNLEQHLDEKGNTQYISTSKFFIGDSEGNPLGIYGKVKDITKQVMAHQRYTRELQELYHMEEDDFYIAVIDLDQWKLVEHSVNPRFGCTFPMECSLDDLLKTALSFITTKPDDAFAFYSNFSQEYIRNIFSHGKDNIVFEYLHTLNNGERLWMQDIIKLRINPETNHLMVLLSIQSIDARKKKELELRKAAQIDGLTGLMNRKYAADKIEQILACGGAAGQYSLFIIDIDDFKNVNDSYGHQIGDKLLVNVAQALKNSFRKDDIIGRLGGDEFFAFMERTEGGVTTPERATQILSNVNQACCDYFDLNISVSIGICDYPQNGTNLEMLYNNADKALYQAKSNGKKQFHIFSKT